MSLCVCCGINFERPNEQEVGVCHSCIAQRERIEKIVRDTLITSDLQIRDSYHGFFVINLNNGFDINIDISNIYKSEKEI